MRKAIQQIRSSETARNGAIAVVFVLGVLCAAGPSFVSEVTGYDALVERTRGLLDEGMLENQRTFLVFSAIKASLALIEGSTFGVGVELQVGDLIQPAYDYVDFFWNVFLCAFVVMGFYKILLDAGILTLGFVLIGAGLMLWALSVKWPSERWNVRAFSRRLMLLGALLTYALPISLLASDAIGDRYVSKLKTEHQRNIAEFRMELEATRIKFFGLKDEISLLHPGESIENLQHGLKSITESAARSFQLTYFSFMYFALIVVFELLVLPFCTAILLFLLARRLLEGVVAPRTPQVQIVAEGKIV